LVNTLCNKLLAYMSSASGGFAPNPTRVLPLDPLGDFCPQSPGFDPLRNKFLATPLSTWPTKNQKKNCQVLVIDFWFTPNSNSHPTKLGFIKLQSDSPGGATAYSGGFSVKWFIRERHCIQRSGDLYGADRLVTSDCRWSGICALLIVYLENWCWHSGRGRRLLRTWDNPQIFGVWLNRGEGNRGRLKALKVCFGVVRVLLLLFCADV